MSTCTLRADAVGCAFSALEPDEERALRAHLPHCASCRRALDEAREVAAALGAAVPPVEPPPDLRRRLLDAASATPPRSRPTPHDPGPARQPGREAARTGAAGEPAHRPTGWTRQRRRRVVTAAAAVVAAVVLGVGLVVARAVLPTQATSGDTPAVTLAQQADRIIEDARARDPQLRAAVLRGPTGAPVAVVLDPGDAAAPIRLMGVAMPPTGPSHDYVLWATGLPGNAPVAIAVMDPADGVTRPVNATTGPATPDERTPRGWAMSVEPSGPVPARPSTVVAAGIAT